MKKIMITVSIAAIIFITLSFNETTKVQVSTSDQKQLGSSPITQTVSTKKSAVMKIATDMSNTGTPEAETKAEKDKVIVDLLELQQIADIGKTLAASFKSLPNQKKMKPLLDFLIDYPFAEEFKAAYSEMHTDSLRAILEVQQHGINKVLVKNQANNETKILEHFKEKKDHSNSSDKQEVIDAILEESNLISSTQQTTSKMLESIYTYTISEQKPNLNIAEARSMANKQALQHSKAQAKAIKIAMDITYGGVSKDELREYLRFLEKVDAAKATSLALAASDKALSRFSKKLAEQIVKQSKIQQ
jgi:hypothetical protein